MALKLDREVIARIAQRHGGSRIRLFGSALTDRFDPERSDVDLLVEFQGGFDEAMEGGKHGDLMPEVWKWVKEAQGLCEV